MQNKTVFTREQNPEEQQRKRNQEREREQEKCNIRIGKNKVLKKRDSQN